MDALAAANTDAPAYGGDEITDEFHELLEDTFGSGAYGFPVFNGTGANIVALQAVSRPHSSVICADTAHVYTSESSAPVRAGLSLKPQPHRDGKLDPADVAKVLASDVGNPQATQPAAVTISQLTEMGTVYTPEELTQLCNTVHEAGLAIHMDGARLAQAAAALGLDLHGATTALGVDILSLGATKNGAMGAEAVVVKDPEANIDFSRVVHADERFTHHRPIVAGDELAATVTVESVKSLGGHSMITTRADIATTAGEPVSTVRSTLLVRGEES